MTVSVHKIVHDSFVGPKIQGQQCRHMNGDRRDNRASNLQWGTRAENTADRMRHGTTRRGESQPASKVTESDVIEIARAASNGETLASIAKRYGISTGGVQHITSGDRWKHISRPVVIGRRRPKRGSENKNAKLTEEKVARILVLLRAGARHSEIAAEYGVHKGVIGGISTGRMWKHVPRPEPRKAEQCMLFR